MRRRVTFALAACMATLALAGCGPTSTADKIMASAKSDYHASNASCSREINTARLGGQRFNVYDCQLDGVGEIFRPPGVRSASFRRCYVYNQGPVAVDPSSMRTGSS